MKQLLLLLSCALLSLRSPWPAITLPGYFSCQATLLRGTDHALAVYSATQQACRSGRVVLAYEMRGERTAAGKAHFTIRDTVQITLKRTQQLDITVCTTATGKPTQYFVLYLSERADHQHLRHVQRVWGVSAQQQLVEVPVQRLTCVNNDFGA